MTASWEMLQVLPQVIRPLEECQEYTSLDLLRSLILSEQFLLQESILMCQGPSS